METQTIPELKLIMNEKDLENLAVGDIIGVKFNDLGDLKNDFFICGEKMNQNLELIFRYVGEKIIGVIVPKKTMKCLGDGSIYVDPAKHFSIGYDENHREYQNKKNLLEKARLWD